jgi:glutamyl-tRNA synthetase
MEEDTKIEDVVNKESKFETKVLAEVCLAEMKKGDIIQLERRGYFYVDKVADEHSEINLHFIPDGKSKNISVIKTKIDVKSLSKGEDNNDKQSEKEAKKLEREKKKEAKADKKAKKENNKKEEENLENSSKNKDQEK